MSAVRWDGPDKGTGPGGVKLGHCRVHEMQPSRAIFCPANIERAEMSEAAASLPAPAPRRRRSSPGRPPFEPSREERDLVSVMAALGAGHDTMIAILARNNVPCANRRTLRKAFRAELREGRENLVTTLGLRMVRLATTDGPHSFRACAFLLRTWGGPQWRVPKGDDDDLHAAAAAAEGVHVYIPTEIECDPPPPMIDGQAEPEEGQENVAPATD